MTLRALVLIPVAVLVTASSCKSSPPPAPEPAPAPAPSAAAEKQRGLDLEGMDRSVPPGDDFFAYANGTWLKTTEIPADRSNWGVFGQLVELTSKRTADLIKESENAPAGSDARKIGDYYASFMDEAAIEAKGLAPLKPVLDQVAAIADRKQLSRYLGSTLRADVDAINSTDLYTDNLFGLWVAQDFDDPKKYSPFLMQGGLGMPDRDYYLSDSPRMAALREQYQAHIASMLKLAGIAEPEAKAKRIFELERKIAQGHATVLDTSDVKKGNNHWKRADFDKKAPGMDWAAFFSTAGLEGQGELVVWQPSAVVGSSALVKSVPLQTWKEYLTFQAIAHAAPFLPKAFVEESFAFRGKALHGTPQLRERWKRAISATDEALGEAVGKLYVERYFPAAEKARAEEMVKFVMAAFGRRIDALEWMKPETKEKAKAKLAAMKVYVGYPDTWRDYSALEVVRGDALGNAQRAELFEYRRNVAKLGKPVDRSEWVMNPQLVNAVNLPAMNAMNFPAAILQPPFFDPERPAVMDYGAIGSVIGHEISHSFDNMGALFDAEGRLNNWWTQEDFAHFEAASKRLVAQYGAYRPFPDLAVNGQLTLGENIADVAGLAAAYDAYRMSLNGAEAPEYQGLTGDQQFFVAFAQAWRSKAREQAARQRVLTDGHSPPEFRAATVRNLDAWYAAFKIEPGQKLFLAPADRVRIW